jgi:Predicted integral membrane protein (DUF2275)/Putative zinc-finger
MNCEEIQKYLSGFLDKSLDVERSQEIGDHLAACSLCSEEMASLAECRRLVSTLPEVEPPVGFTTRVMAHVREAARKPSLWEGLFFPLQIKIPLQATAVVLIAVCAAYIYQKEPLQRVVTVQPERSFGKPGETDKLAPSVAQAPTADSRTTEITEETKLRVQEFKDSVQRKEPQSPSKPEEQNKGIAGSQPDAQAAALPRDRVRSPATLSPTPLQENPSVASGAASPRLEQSPPLGEVQAKGALAPAPQPEKENASKDAAAAGKSLASPEPRERDAAPSLDALGSGTVAGVGLAADYEVAIRLKEPVRDDNSTEDRFASDRAQAERRTSTSQEEAKNLAQARQRAVQTGQAQAVWVTIARNQYELYKKELSDLGNIEMELALPVIKNDAISKSSDQLRIKITILPPSLSGNTVPSQPSSR